MYHAELKAHQKSKYREALLVGGCFALGALPASASIILWMKGKSSLQWMILTSVVAAFIAGTILWRKVFGQGRRPTFWRGAGVGALVVVAAHLLAWYLLFLLLFFMGDPSSLRDEMVHPLRGLLGSLRVTAASLMLFGWITIPIGALIGGGLGYAAGKEWEKSAGLQ
jgi:hypothetical protein